MVSPYQVAVNQQDFLLASRIPKKTCQLAHPKGYWNISVGGITKITELNCDVKFFFSVTWSDTPFLRWKIRKKKQLPQLNQRLLEKEKYSYTNFSILEALELYHLHRVTRCPHWPSVVKFKQLTEFEKQLNLQVGELEGIDWDFFWKFTKLEDVGPGREKKYIYIYVYIYGPLLQQSDEKMVWVRKLVCQYFQCCFFFSEGGGIPLVHFSTQKNLKILSLNLAPWPIKPRACDHIWSEIDVAHQVWHPPPSFVSLWKTSFPEGLRKMNLIHTSHFYSKKKKMCLQSRLQRWPSWQLTYPTIPPNGKRVNHHQTYLGWRYVIVPTRDTSLKKKTAAKTNRQVDQTSRNVTCSLAAIKSSQSRLEPWSFHENSFVFFHEKWDGNWWRILSYLH